MRDSRKPPRVNNGFIKLESWRSAAQFLSPLSSAPPTPKRVPTPALELELNAPRPRPALESGILAIGALGTPSTQDLPSGSAAANSIGRPELRTLRVPPILVSATDVSSVDLVDKASCRHHVFVPKASASRAAAHTHAMHARPVRTRAARQH
eukprot:tig00021462_g21567.t1